jgi:hypothetical protein
LSEKKLYHCTTWLPEDLYLFILRLELEENSRTGDGVGHSTIIRRLIRQEFERVKALESQDPQGENK